jgi:hypothetical protein
MLFIPKKIKVGYQNRQDTYTGKLAYVIYLGKDAKWKKETSWEGWRDDNIEPQEFVNEPTEGFVLNKKAGDYKSSWGGRKAYSRIYDPRGFEFEIDVDNLLFILENVASNPGKALDGKFVYTWNKGDMFLLPTNCLDYPYIQEFSDMKEKKINPKKLKIGAEYFCKTNGWCLYLGEFLITMDNRYWWLEFPHETAKVFRAQNGTYFYEHKPSFVQEREFSGDLSSILTDFIENSILTDQVESFRLEGDCNRQFFYTDGVNVYDDRYRNYGNFSKLTIDDGRLIFSRSERPQNLTRLDKDIRVTTKKGKEYSYYGGR